MMPFLMAPYRTMGMIGLLLVVPVVVAAQAGMRETPASASLSGSVTARNSSPWLALSNPASLAGQTVTDILCAYSPSTIGIDGPVQGTMIATIPLDSLRSGALSAGGTGLPGYREMTASAIFALRSGSISFGANLSLLS